MRRILESLLRKEGIIARPWNEEDEKAYIKARNKAYHKTYRQRPEVKARMKASNKAYQKAYYQRRKLSKTSNRRKNEPS